MKRLLPAALAAGVITLAACSSAAPSSSPSSPAPAALSPYTQAIDAMAGECTQSPAVLEAMTGTAYQQLLSAGVTRTMAQVAAGAAASANQVAGPADCTLDFADYVEQQEGH